MKLNFFGGGLLSVLMFLSFGFFGEFAIAKDDQMSSARIPVGMEGVWKGTSTYYDLDDTTDAKGPQSEYSFSERFVITDKVFYSVRAEGTPNERFELDLLKFYNNPPMNSFDYAKNHNNIHYGKGSGYCNSDTICLLNIYANDAALERGAAGYTLNITLLNPSSLLLEGIRVCKNQVICTRWNIKLEKTGNATGEEIAKIDEIVAKMNGEGNMSSSR